ncbi:unnamed protein product [Ectocarpus sp. 4 AP-2014]
MMLLRTLLFIPSVLGIKPSVVAGIDARVKATLPAGQQRSWVDIPRRREGTERKGEAASDRIRILSYNVLGARQGLADKHDHVGVDIRNWPTRRDRLREEIWSYCKSDPGGIQVICLQEVTFRTLGYDWLPFMAKLGLDRHVYQPKSDRPQRRHRSRCLGVAIFYSSTHFEKMAEVRVVFSEETRGLREDSGREGERSHSSGASETPEAVPAAPKATTTRAGKGAAPPCDQFLRRVYGGDTGRGAKGEQDPATVSRLEQDLANRHDAAALVRLRLKESDDLEEGASGKGVSGGGGKNGRSFTVVCAHLFYDPNRPDLKTAQCQMLFQAIDRLHQKCGVASALGGGKAGSEIPSLGPANLVLCADFNSKPLVDPWFLPGPLKAAAQARLQTTSAIGSQEPSAPTPGSQPNTSKDVYPSSQATASGVYCLLNYGCVPPTHPEHPDTFIPEWLKRKEQEEISRQELLKMGGGKVWKPRRNRRTRGAPVVPAEHRPSGEWVSGFGDTLEDAYRDRGAVSPSFTTKTSSFSGIIDHIFVSTGEKDSGLAISGVLAFPPGAHLTEGRETSSSGEELEQSSGGSGQEATPDRQVENSVTDQPAWSEFGPIPNKLWGSDHLALGVELVLL